MFILLTDLVFKSVRNISFDSLLNQIDVIEALKHLLLELPIALY